MIENNQWQTTYSADLLDALTKIGWTPSFEKHLNLFDANRFSTARVVGVRKNSFYVSQGKAAWRVTISGSFNRRSKGMYPVAGDWVVIANTVIHAILPRKNALSRGASGMRAKQDAAPMREQMIAANLDTVFIVCGLDRDFNLRRIERYLTLVYNCGLNPAIILTKSDLHLNPEQFAGQVEAVAVGVPVHTVSAQKNIGLDQMEKYLLPGQTITMIGSSGSGKSTLVNRLYGETVQATGVVSDYGKGRHTTTNRDLIILPAGAMVIDNPGIREIAFWDDEGGITHAFPEIEDLAFGCRFADCSHQHEPGCRVLQAVDAGEISWERVRSYHKLKRELMFLADRRHKSADRLEKERWKAVALKVKQIKKRGRNA